MKTIISSLETMTGNKIGFKVSGMRPGEKIHEDMLAETELEFTYEVDEKLMVVLPQYTNKKHSYSKKYNGPHYNSSLHLDNDVEKLKDLINKGLNC